MGLSVSSGFLLSSIASVASRWHDCGERVEVEIDDGLKGLGGDTIAQAVGQRVMPGGILGLQRDQLGDGVVPTLSSGPSVRRPTVTDLGKRLVGLATGAIDLMSVSSPGEPGKGSKARALPWTRQGRSPWNQSVRCLRPRPELPSPDASVAAPKV